MAHFAELNENGTVLRVIVVHNNELLDENGNESEEKGIKFCKDHYGQETNWIQTSYNSTFRKNFAGPGYVYDNTDDAFIPPKPYNSWVLNESTCQWDAPVAMPTDADKRYTWDETTTNWVEVIGE
jgi:hypothetical protein